LQKKFSALKLKKWGCTAREKLKKWVCTARDVPGTKTGIIIVTINVKVKSEDDTFSAIGCNETAS
jgi:hypothetical protein